MKKRIIFLLGMFLLVIASLTGCKSSSNAPDTMQSTISDESDRTVSDTSEVSALPDETTEEDVSLSENAANPSSDADADKPEETTEQVTVPSVEDNSITEDGEYTSKEEVAEYLHLFGHLPGNFITKDEAKQLGWVSSEGNLGKVAPGKSIGGDYFGNYEGNLPKKDGRTYHECDIDSDGGYRGAKRIVYSNDGFIYYTEDHYETFELLYGNED